MAEQNSILDKIIQSKQQKEAAQFDPSETVAVLFKNLSNKEQDVLNRRFGLFGQEKQTLEQIGKHYEITRERIRQIEVGTIKKLKELEDFRQQIEVTENNITHLLEKYGGIMEENHLIDELLTYTETNVANRQAALFVVGNLLNDKLEKIRANNHFLPSWKLPTVSTELIQQALASLIEIIKTENRLLATDELLKKFQNHDFFQKNQLRLVTVQLTEESAENQGQGIEAVLHSLLTISKNVDQNILGEWGLNNWQTVTPRRMSDKAYLVLRKTSKPLHFTDITNLINEAGFDRKIAYPATIHNELILDDRYVLVGRGIYGLKEWGYQPGTVIDVIVDILKKSDQPLTKEEIVKQVLDQRIVRKSTIYLALTDKTKIKKLPDNRYTLA